MQEGGIQTPNGTMYPNGAFIDNEGDTYYCSPDSYNLLDPDFQPIEPSFPEEFLELYNGITELKWSIYSMTQQVKENAERIEELEAKIEELKTERSELDINIDMLDFTIAAAYSVATALFVLITIAAIPAAGIGITLLYVDAYLITDTIDAWITATYQPLRADKTEEIKKLRKQKNVLEYENFVLSSEKNISKGQIRIAREKLEALEGRMETYFPGMQEVYEKYKNDNYTATATINPIN